MMIPHYYEDPHTLHVGTMPNRALQIIAFITQSLVGHAYPTTINAYSGVYF